MEVSVIIPVYNAEQWLQKCIDSVLIHPCVKEVLLINDGSTDGSLAIMKAMASTDTRIVILSHPSGTNHGRSASRNLGIRHAKYEWISFLDADDYYLDNRFVWTPHSTFSGYYGTIQSEYHVNKEHSNMDSFTGIHEEILPSELFDFLTEQGDQYFSLISLTIKKASAIAIGGFDETLQIGEDTDFIWRLSFSHELASIGHTNPIAIRTVHGKNTYRENPTDRFPFYEKWLNQKEYPLSRDAKQRIRNAYAYYHPIHQRWPNGFVRALIKLFNNQ